MSVWDLYDTVVQCGGLTEFAWSSPNPVKLKREVRARFASAAHARAGFEALVKLPARGTCTALLTPSDELTALVLPPEMSHPDRIQKDEALSAEVVRRLDRLTGVAPEATEALLGRQALPIAKLDLQVLYLRRVHCFCFYAAAWCDHEWDLRQRCGAAALRESLSGAGKAAAEGEWAKAHDERLQCFLETAELQRPAGLDVDADCLAGPASALSKEKTFKVSEGKFRCLECGKHFKGPEYVHKHLRKVHGNLFEALRRQAWEAAAAAAYLEDKGRPLVAITAAAQPRAKLGQASAS